MGKVTCHHQGSWNTHKGIFTWTVRKNISIQDAWISPLHSGLLVGGTAALTEVSQRINLSVIVYLKGCLFSVNLVSWRTCFCHLTNLPVTASVLCSILTLGRSKSRTWQKSSSITHASESDLISEDLPSLQTNEKAFHTIIDNLWKLREDNPRPVGVANEKFDLGDDKVFLFEDCMFTSMPDKDTSNGGVSWCSGSFQEPISDPVVLVSSPGSSNFLSRGIDSCAWESGTDPHIVLCWFPFKSDV